MSKLTYHDLQLVREAGGTPTFSNTAWWVTDKNQQDWYVTESDENQYLLFSPKYNLFLGTPMSREAFEELFYD
jgi:hypothetical protein